MNEEDWKFFQKASEMLFEKTEKCYRELKLIKPIWQKVTPDLVNLVAQYMFLHVYQQALLNREYKKTSCDTVAQNASLNAHWRLPLLTDSHSSINKSYVRATVSHDLTYKAEDKLKQSENTELRKTLSDSNNVVQQTKQEQSVKKISLVEEKFQQLESDLAKTLSAITSGVESLMTNKISKSLKEQFEEMLKYNKTSDASFHHAAIETIAKFNLEDVIDTKELISQLNKSVDSESTGHIANDTEETTEDFDQSSAEICNLSFNKEILISSNFEKAAASKVSIYLKQTMHLDHAISLFDSLTQQSENDDELLTNDVPNNI